MGSAVLGHDLYQNAPLAPPWARNQDGISVRHPAKAAVYGFHATIVAPFATNDLVSDLIASLNSLARRHRAFELGPLELSVLEPGFPALIPKNPNIPELFALEREMIAGFLGHRLPLEPIELARRGPLTSRQRFLAKRWGYPYVLDQFRYHLTLGDSLRESVTGCPEERSDSGRLASGLAQDFADALERLFPPDILSGLGLASLCLCVQPDLGQPFEVISIAKLRNTNDPPNRSCYQRGCLKMSQPP
jgi:hypothetical protein